MTPQRVPITAARVLVSKAHPWFWFLSSGGQDVDDVFYVGAKALRQNVSGRRRHMLKSGGKPALNRLEGIDAGRVCHGL